MHRASLPYWLLALYLPNVGPQKIAKWLTRFSDITSFFQAPFPALKAAGVDDLTIKQIQSPNWSQVEKDLRWGEGTHHHIITLDDERYPAQLKEITDPPILLYVQGDPAILSSVQLAVVGARHATPMGLQNAEQFSSYLAENDFTITSGLAMGIDGASHRGALKVNGKTIGVAGTGLKHVYPPKHRDLVADIIAEQGAVVSEFPLDTLPRPGNFPRRNRVISGLSAGVLVVEAALKSGSLITARMALDANREVFAIPGSIHQPQSKGCHYLIRQGAKLVETANDIVEELGGLRRLLSAQTSFLPDDMPDNLDLSCKTLLTVIDYGVTPMDLIMCRSGLTASEVSSILLRLELQNCVQSVPGGYIKMVRQHV